MTILGGESEAAKARRRLVSETLRPAETTDRWSQIAPAERLALSEAGCRGIALIEAADERDEALAIAVALRETLEEPGRTAALVTPDRALAIRVVAELDRWAVRVEDSAGCTLAETAMGRLARLAADAALHDFDPVRVLALLAEPAGPARAVPRGDGPRRDSPRDRRAARPRPGAGPRRPAQGAAPAARRAHVQGRAAGSAPDRSGRRPRGRPDRAACRRLRQLRGRGPRRRRDEPPRPRRAAPPRRRDAFGGSGGRGGAGRPRPFGGGAGEPFRGPSRLGLRADRGAFCRLSGLLRNPGAPGEDQPFAAGDASAPEDPRSPGSAPPRRRPGRARRARRGPVATADGDRRLSQPPDARRHRPLAARAAHRPDGARFRPGARLRRRRDLPRRKARRQADGALPFPAAPQGLRRRARLRRQRRRRRALPPPRAPPRHAEAGAAAAAPEAAARPGAVSAQPFGDRDRDPGARPLCDLSRATS